MMKKIYKIILILILSSAFLISNSANGQAGLLDSTFGVNGKIITSLYGWDYCFSAAVQSDGKIILAGFSYVNLPYDDNFAVVRYTVDGNLDSTFSSDGIDTADIKGYFDEAYDVTIQADGKIILCGASHGGNNDLYTSLIRYNTDGTLDTSFGSGGKVSTVIGNSFSEGRSVVVKPNGKIIVGGMAFFSTYDIALSQYNSDGSLDTSFGYSGIANSNLPGNDYVNEIAVQPDGKIVVAATSASGFVLMRFNANGIPDTSFNNTGIVIDTVGGFDGQSLVIQTNSKIVVGGSSQVLANHHFTLARYNTDGTLDTAFGVSGKSIKTIGFTNSAIYSVLIQPGGKILTAGYAQVGGSAFAAARFNTNGAIDSTFGVNGVAANTVGPSTNDPFKICLQPSGKIIIAGWSYMNGNPDFSMIRYGNDLNTEVGEIIKDKNSFIVYPNPVTNQSVFIFDNPENEKFLFTLYDITGRITESVSTTIEEIIITKGSKPAGVNLFNLTNEKTGESVKGKIVIGD